MILLKKVFIYLGLIVFMIPFAAHVVSSKSDFAYLGILGTYIIIVLLILGLIKEIIGLIKGSKK